MTAAASAAAAAARQTIVLIVCVTVLASVVIVAVVVAFVLVPEGTNTVLLVTVLVGMLPPTVASLIAVLSIRQVSAGQTDMASDVGKLANGIGDAKFRAAVADVVDPAYHAPGAEVQREVDKAVLEAAHEDPRP